jgi:hypothetical protein
VIKQNVVTSSMEALSMQGQPVRLVWDRQHLLPVMPDNPANPPAGPDQPDAG